MVYKKELPERYYVTHFDEIIDTLLEQHHELLSIKETDFITSLRRLPAHAYQLYIRLLSRKPRYIRSDSLNFSDIDNFDDAMSVLHERKLLSTETLSTCQSVLHYYTKDELIALSGRLLVLDLELNMPKKSAKKQVWESFVKEVCSDLNISLDDDHHIEFVALKHNQTLSFLMYLFFGKMGMGLSQFAMRDLNVLKTRQVNADIESAFNSYEEAQSAFYYANLLFELKHNSSFDLQAQFAQIQTQNIESPLGQAAFDMSHLFLYRLGCKLKRLNEQDAMSLFASSEHAGAKEEYIRYLYKQGDHDKCRSLLNTVLESTADEKLLLFAEDFYQLKFTHKKTSILTDVVRASPPPILVDEAYKNIPEQGVVDHLKGEGLKAFHCENMLWRTLFTLTFWPELFEHSKNKPTSEFELTPKLIKEGTFYDVLKADIEKRLEALTSREKWKQFILQQACLHYGTPTRLLHWYEAMFIAPLHFLNLVNLEALKSMMRKIAKDYRQMSSGFPDLLVYDENTVRFIEVKAPGDVLRPNQLVTLNALKASGFDATIQRLEWDANPEQLYAVVDIETTGGNKERDRITEIAVVKMKGSEVIDRWESLVNPKRRISRQITALTGITNEMVCDAPDIVELLPEFADFTSGCIFVAHNVNFDYGFLKQAFSRHGLSYSRAKLCTVKLARQWLPKQASYSLANLCKAYEIELKQHHRAMADANAASEVLKLINDHRNNKKQS